jgi:hypothetical protein
MLIRMTRTRTHITGVVATAAAAVAGLLAAGGVAASGLLDPEADPALGPPHVLIVDAAAGRDGRELVDRRLLAVDAEVRLPRTAAEARTNVRYFDAQGYRVVVAGPQARAAARSAGVSAVPVSGVREAVAAVADL